MNASSSVHLLIDELIYSLRRMAAQGLRGFDCSPEALSVVGNWGTAPKVLPIADTLPRIHSDLDQCRRCGLAQARTRIVFGSGDSNADLVFVGSGLEHEDDQQGEPFSGPAGQLLMRIIAAMKLTRRQVYLCNILKCRPPNGRDPDVAEINACAPFLKRQITAIAPKVICSLGTLATQTLLHTDQSISLLRGRFHDFDGIKVMPTHHPLELLRYPEKKRETWADIQKIMHLLKIPVA